MARILVTGAGGFIGRALCRGLAARGHQVIAGLRGGLPPGAPPIEGAEPRILGEIAPGRDWSGALGDVDLVVHLAQRAHRRAAEHPLAGEPEAAAGLASAAAQAGVRRFLYMSSIKAMGDATPPGRRFRADDVPRPEDAYGRAKLASERALARVAEETGLELVILRPPLVYGPGCRRQFPGLGAARRQRPAAAVRRARQPPQPDFHRQPRRSRRARRRCIPPLPGGCCWRLTGSLCRSRR